MQSTHIQMRRHLWKIPLFSILLVFVLQPASWARGLSAELRASLKERELSRHFPDWSRKAKRKRQRPRDRMRFSRVRPEEAKRRQEVFDKAPRELFVFPKQDLDGLQCGALSLPGEKGLYPLRGEPLLVVKVVSSVVRVLTSDGLTTTIRSPELLTLSPPAKIRMPPPNRNLSGEKVNDLLDEMVPAPSGKLGRFNKLRKKFQRCYQSYWKKHQPKSGNWSVVTYHGGKLKRVEDLDDRIERRARKKCGASRYERKKRGVKNMLKNAQIAVMRGRLSRLQQRLSGQE
jgi:hypothetical protein